MNPRFLLTSVLVALAASCSNLPPANLPAGASIGEPMQVATILPLSLVQKEPAKYFEKTLLVEGRIKAVCQKKGCWMQIEDGNRPALVRWETGCGGKFAFPKNAIGERVLVQGSFYEKKLDPADAAHMEEEAGQRLDIPAKGYEMNASSVRLLDRHEE